MNHEEYQPSKDKWLYKIGRISYGLPYGYINTKTQRDYHMCLTGHYGNITVQYICEIDGEILVTVTDKTANKAVRKMHYELKKLKLK